VAFGCGADYLRAGTEVAWVSVPILIPLECAGGRPRESMPRERSGMGGVRVSASEARYARRLSHKGVDAISVQSSAVPTRPEPQQEWQGTGSDPGWGRSEGKRQKAVTGCPYAFPRSNQPG
jgi:hypothetical protein